MAMPKDSSGNLIFVSGRMYRPRVFVNSIWPVGAPAKCVGTEPYIFGREGGTEEVIANGKGIFTVGNDTRSYVATNQFEEVKE